MRWWWLSFCDPDRPKGEQFLGASIVESHDPINAVREAHALKCNPGGEVQITPAPEGFEMPKDLRAAWCNRLLTREECAQADKELGAAANPSPQRTPPPQTG